MTKIKIAGLAAEIRRIGLGGKAAAQRGILSGALRCVPEMQRRSKAAGAFNIGTYVRSWRAIPTPNGAKIWNVSGVEAAVIEDGRRAGARMPPPAAIQRWAQRKLGLSAKQAKGAAFVLARAIAVKGIKGKHILRDAVPALIKIVTAEAFREMRRTIK